MKTDGTLSGNWGSACKVRITRLVQAPETGKYDYRGGTKGNKLTGMMAPMPTRVNCEGMRSATSPAPMIPCIIPATASTSRVT